MLTYQSARTQMLYADLCSEAHTSEVQTGHGMSFVSKMLKGRRYWYLSVAAGQARRQTYLGPDTPELQARMEATRTQWTQARHALQERESLVGLLTASGAAPTPLRASSALLLLAESGVFKAGAVLTGALAYAAYANHLGVRWSVDPLPSPERIALAISPDGVDWQTLREAQGLRHLPGEALLGREPATRDTGSGELVDVLAPLSGKKTDGPVFIERAGVHAHPLPYLDYLLVYPQPAVLLVRHGIPVCVPEAARFALHTLAIPEHRDHAWQAKPAQNLPHTLELLKVLVHEAPDALCEALASARQHSAALYTRLLKALGTVTGELGARLQTMADETT